MTTKQPDVGVGHCLHHDQHWEWCIGLQARLTYINREKATDELPLRNALIGVVPEGIAPDAAGATWNPAGAKVAAAGATWNPAWTEVAAARVSWNAIPSVKAYHDTRWPQCPWYEAGRTIFTRRNGAGIWAMKDGSI